MLTNLTSFDAVILAFNRCSEIEAIFKDCKTGGYDLESTHACGQRLMALILLIIIAYTCAIKAGRQCRNMGFQKYVGRLQELERRCRRHSLFWIGLYGQLWVGVMEYWSDLALALMRLKPGFTTLFPAWSTSHAAYPVCYLAYMSPRQRNQFGWVAEQWIGTYSS